MQVLFIYLFFPTTPTVHDTLSALIFTKEIIKKDFGDREVVHRGLVVS